MCITESTASFVYTCPEISVHGRKGRILTFFFFLPFWTSTGHCHCPTDTGCPEHAGTWGQVPILTKQKPFSRVRAGPGPSVPHHFLNSLGEGVEMDPAPAVVHSHLLTFESRTLHGLWQECSPLLKFEAKSAFSRCNNKQEPCSWGMPSYSVSQKMALFFPVLGSTAV